MHALHARGMHSLEGNAFNKLQCLNSSIVASKADIFTCKKIKVVSIISNSSESSRISLDKTYTELHSDKRKVSSHANMQMMCVVDLACRQ